MRSPLAVLIFCGPVGVHGERIEEVGGADDKQLGEEVDPLHTCGEALGFGSRREGTEGLDGFDEGCCR